MAALWKRLEGRARFIISHRGFSTASLAGNSVIVERGNGQMALETVWLRDHCRAGGRYSWETHQRDITVQNPGKWLTWNICTGGMGYARDAGMY